MRRRAVLAVVIASALFPGAASGATLSSNAVQIQYTAAAGEANGLTISRDGGEYVFTDAAAVTVTPSAPCVSAGTNAARCPAAGVGDVRADLNDLNDTVAIAASVTREMVSFVALNGGDGSDAVSGGVNVDNQQLNGDDFFGGAPGNDVITGGEHDDFLIAEDGNDTLIGAGGDDRLAPGPGNDLADGGAGRDQFEFDAGPDGADTLIGGPGSLDRVDLRDRLDDLRVALNAVADDGTGCPGAGCEGDDYRPDIEEIDSGQGNDVLIGAPGPQELAGEGGNDALDGGEGEDEVSGDQGDDSVAGGAGNDEVSGADGADALDGGAGDDTLFSEFSDDGADLIGGGGGTDELVGGELLPLRIDLDGEADDGISDPLLSSPLDNVLASVEGLEGGAADDVLIGSKRDNQLEGGAGDDRLAGKAGLDGLVGGRGGDRLNGGKGRDGFEGDAGADKIKSRDGGPDEVSCGSSRDVVKADRADRAGADCDVVKRSGGGG